MIMNEPSLLDFIKAKLMPWKYSISEEYLLALSNDNDTDNRVIVH